MTKTKMLHELSRDTPIRVTLQPDGRKVDGTFHHLDGMYSYCTLKTGQVFHLAVWTPMREVNGRWEIDENGGPQFDYALGRDSR